MTGSAVPAPVPDPVTGLHHWVRNGRAVCGSDHTTLRDDGRPWCPTCYPIWRRDWARAHMTARDRG